jgi:hypothetical protein
MILAVPWDDGLWTLSFGLSQSHGHGSWLVREVAMSLRKQPVEAHQDFKKIMHYDQGEPTVSYR